MPLTPAELAEQLGCSESYVRKQVRARAWPHLRPGNRVTFLPRHVEAIIALLERGPVEAPVGPTRERLLALGVSPRSAAIIGNKELRRRAAAARLDDVG